MYLKTPVSTQLFKNPAQILYRHIIKHIPRVLALYDIPVEPAHARQVVRWHFQNNGHVKDPRVIDMLLSKASMEIEETLMQWKQRVHILEFLNSVEKPSKFKDEYERDLAKFYAGDFSEDD